MKRPLVRIVLALVVLTTLIVGPGAMPAAADGPLVCPHSNVGPTTYGNFWTYEFSYTSLYNEHRHVWKHYVRGSDGRYYYRDRGDTVCFSH